MGPFSLVAISGFSGISILHGSLAKTSLLQTSFLGLVAPLERHVNLGLRKMSNTLKIMKEASILIALTAAVIAGNVALLVM